MQKTNLMDLFDEEDQKRLEKESQKILIFDGNNLVYRTLHTAIYQSREDNDKFYFWRHIFMNSLLTTIHKFQPNKVVVAFDARRSWRYNIFPEYKNKRKLSRSKSFVDFDKFYPILNSFKEDFEKTFTPIHVVEVESAEADDVIAVLVKDKFSKNDIIIVSSDTDMNQLLMYDNIKQFDPIKKKMINVLNPIKSLDVKILAGDTGDCIPPIRKGIGKVNAEKILKLGIDTFLEQENDNTLNENYQRNKQLIDFNYIPKDIVNVIINTFDNSSISNFKSNSIFSFFTKHKLNKLMDDWQSYQETFAKLIHE